MEQQELHLTVAPLSRGYVEVSVFDTVTGKEVRMAIALDQFSMKMEEILKNKLVRIHNEMYKQTKENN